MSEEEEHPKIGLALSGGGARAVAFHLGCLRALHQHGILSKVRVLSTVSGGSIIGAIYSMHEGSFTDFETKVQAVLRSGFLSPSFRTIFTTMEGLKAAFSFVLVLSVYLIFGPILWLAGLAEGLSGRRKLASSEAGNWLPRRFASRTTILQKTMDRLLFKGRTLGSLPDTRPRWIGVAAELRTGVPSRDVLEMAVAVSGAMTVSRLAARSIMLLAGG